MNLKPLNLANVAYAIACVWIATSIAVFLWTLLTTQVNLNTVGRFYVGALAIVALVGVVAAVFAKTKASSLELASYRRFIFGSRPTDRQECLAWRWGRVAMNCWIIVMTGLLVLGLGLKTAFRP